MEKIGNTINCNLVLAARELDDISRYGSLTLNKNGQVTGFIEKRGKPASGYINGGVYYIDKPSFLKNDFPEVFSFENDYLMKYYPDGKLYGMISHGYFIDIGIPETYLQAQTDFFTFDD
jgi:D-glycero-alpha-D-manno-heptose 1-phosphate guanylyltransferase